MGLIKSYSVKNDVLNYNYITSYQKFKENLAQFLFYKKIKFFQIKSFFIKDISNHHFLTVNSHLLKVLNKNNFIYKKLLYEKFDPLKYDLKKRNKKKYFSFLSRNKLSTKLYFQKLHHNFKYNFFLQRNKLKRYKNLFWYRQK